MDIENLNTEKDQNGNSLESLNMEKEVTPVTPAPSVMPQSQTTPGTNSPAMNLQPEGIVKPDEKIYNGPEPLMGTTLTENSTLQVPPAAQGTNRFGMNDALNSSQPVETLQPGPIEQPQNNQINTNTQMTYPYNGNGIGNSEIPTPPSNNTNNMFDEIPEPKKKKHTGAMIILIICLMALVAGVVYVVLNQANSRSAVKITPILTEWEKGQELPSDINVYATINNIDASSCTIDKSKINVAATGKYTYTISCPGLASPVESEVTVRDKTGPEVETKEVIVVPDSEVLLEDFIVNCKDASIENGCDINLKEGETPLEELVATIGEYTVTLVVNDDFDNTTEVKAKLIVDEVAPVMTLNCETTLAPETETKATVSEIYEYGITATNDLYNAKKVRTYKFSTNEDYNEAKSEYESTNMLDGLSGSVKFEEKAKAIILTVDIENEALASEFEISEFPQTLEEIKNFHEGEERNDICY